MLLMGKSACLWHAYTAVKEQGKGLVTSGQLKVFAHNLATNTSLLDVDCSELGSSVELKDFLEFLSKTLFSRLPTISLTSELTSSQLQIQQQHREKLERIDEICWLICSKHYSDGTIINNHELYKLWRIFNALAEPSPFDDEHEAAFPVAMDPEEVELIVRRMAFRLKSPFAATDLQSNDENEPISFSQFVDVIEKRCLIGQDEHVTAAVIGELHDDIVANVLKKGYLVKLRTGVGLTAGTSNEQCWYVLTPNYLQIYSRRDESEKRGDIYLSKSSHVENVSDKCGIAIAGIGIGTKTNRFIIHGAFDGHNSKALELCAPDVQTKSEWIQALQQAISWSGSSTYYVELVRRRTTRTAKRKRQYADQLRRLADNKIMEETLTELNAERKAREEAELKLMEESKQRELEQQRIRELEELQQQLESLLIQERQAIRDEEIVRNLQAKVLQEEFEKREELEEIKVDLERLLAMEQSKSGELEEQRRRQEALYKYELERLQVLETERRRRDDEYEEAVSKLNDAERAKDQLRFELDRREMELRLQRGLLVRFNRAESASSDNCAADPSPEIVTHRGRGAFINEPVQMRSNNARVFFSTSTSDDDVITSPSSPFCFDQHATSLSSDIVSTVCVTTNRK